MTLHIHWPQITEIFLIALNFGVNCAKHGEPRAGKYNALGTLIGAGLVVTLLYYGGFWTGGTP